MLVLSRHRDESVIIGNEDIVITVVDICGDKIRLGFTADVSISIHRQEIYEAIRREKRQIAGVGAERRPVPPPWRTCLCCGGTGRVHDDSDRNGGAA